MEPDDSTPREPHLQLDKDLPTLTRDQLLDIEYELTYHQPLGHQLAEVLYNDYIRQVLVIGKLVECLGPADDEILEQVYKEVG